MHFRVSIFGLFKYPIKSPFPASLAERIRRLQLPFITQRRRACLSRCPLLTCMHSLKLMLMHEQLPRPRTVHFGVCIVSMPLTTTCSVATCRAHYCILSTPCYHPAPISDAWWPLAAATPHTETFVWILDTAHVTTTRNGSRCLASHNGDRRGLHGRA